LGLSGPLKDIRSQCCGILRCKQEAPQLQRDPRDAHYQLKYRPTVVRIKTDRVSAWGSLSATVTFYPATCIVLYKHRCTRHRYRTANMQCRARQQSPIQPIFLMSTGPYLWSPNFDYHQCCWRHRVLLRQDTVVDGDHRGGWTQSFGGKASEFQTTKVALKVILKVTGNGAIC